MYTRSQYIYHAERGNSYFGIYNRTENDIQYAITGEGIKTHLYPLKSLKKSSISSPSSMEQQQIQNQTESIASNSSSSNNGSAPSLVVHS
jgi:deoxyribodipyrimidine photolyase